MEKSTCARCDPAVMQYEERCLLSQEEFAEMSSSRMVDAMASGGIPIPDFMRETLKAAWKERTLDELSKNTSELGLGKNAVNEFKTLPNGVCVRVCWEPSCGKDEATGGKFKRCNACAKARYCSRELFTFLNPRVGGC